MWLKVDGKETSLRVSDGRALTESGVLERAKALECLQSHLEALKVQALSELSKSQDYSFHRICAYYAEQSAAALDALRLLGPVKQPQVKIETAPPAPRTVAKPDYTNMTFRTPRKLNKNTSVDAGSKYKLKGA